MKLIIITYQSKKIQKIYLKMFGFWRSWRNSKSIIWSSINFKQLCDYDQSSLDVQFESYDDFMVAFVQKLLRNFYDEIVNFGTKKFNAFFPAYIFD